MSYVSRTLAFLKANGPCTNLEIATGINATHQQVKDVLLQLLPTGRCRIHTYAVPFRKVYSTYVITDYGIAYLASGRHARRPEPKEHVPSIGIVAHAMKTQPVSVWGLAA